MYQHKTSPLKSAQQGVVLIEAMVAILIFSFAVLGIIGLQAAMIKNTSDAKFRVDASNIAQQTIGDMWVHPDNIIDYVKVSPVPQLPSGLLTVTNGLAVDQYVIKVTWQQPGTGELEHNFTAIATISKG